MRKLGTLVDRTHREFTDTEIGRVARTYHAWRGEKGAGEYSDIPGFCKSTTMDEIGHQSHVLTPGRYVGAEESEEDDEPFEEKVKRLTAKLEEQFEEGGRLQESIRKGLASLLNER